MISDSQLIVNQVNGEFECRDDRMGKYMEQVREILTRFGSIKISQVGREQNAHADALAGLASAAEVPEFRTVSIEQLNQASISLAPVASVLFIDHGPSWMDSIIASLKDATLSEDKRVAHQIIHKAARHWLSAEGQLYRRLFSGPYLLCVHLTLAEGVLQEFHSGSCGLHSGGRSLAHRAISQGYWWPKMTEEAERLVKKCDPMPMVRTDHPPTHRGAYSLD